MCCHSNNHPHFCLSYSSGDAAAAPIDVDVDETAWHVFKWDKGGHQVFLTGLCGDWNQRIPMHRSGRDFTHIASLPKVRYE